VATLVGGARVDGEPAPVLEDLSIFLGAGRQKRPALIVEEAVEAERLGLRRGFVSERYDVKLAAPLLGAAAARTTRFEVGTGVLAAGSYHPVMAAAIGATMRAAFGERFVLGLGRGAWAWYEILGITEEPGPMGKQYSFAAFEDYVSIIRRLWRGERITYDGPAGRYREIFLSDPPQCEPPPIWYAILGGERAARVAARIADGVLITDMVTPEGVSKAVAAITNERERCGLDGPFRVAACTVSTPEFDQVQTLAQTSARLLTYVVGIPQAARALAAVNGWDPAVMAGFKDHPTFAAQHAKTADQSFHRHELLEAAEWVPEEWMRECCATGSTADCVAKLAEFRDAGAEEVFLYGSTPADNQRLVAAWRERGGS
jgi:5,10-methylenetetrahydromethanopterin reductase